MPTLIIEEWVCYRCHFKMETKEITKPCVRSGACMLYHPKMRPPCKCAGKWEEKVVKRVSRFLCAECLMGVRYPMPGDSKEVAR